MASQTHEPYFHKYLSKFLLRWHSGSRPVCRDSSSYCQGNWLLKWDAPESPEMSRPFSFTLVVVMGDSRDESTGLKTITLDFKNKMLAQHKSFSKKELHISLLHLFFHFPLSSWELKLKMQWKCYNSLSTSTRRRLRLHMCPSEIAFQCTGMWGCLVGHESRGSSKLYPKKREDTKKLAFGEWPSFSDEILKQLPAL